MRGSRDFAATIYSDRMVAAMQMSGEALVEYDPEDKCAFLQKYHPATEFHRAVAAYVAHLKGVGLSPEKALVAG